MQVCTSLQTDNHANTPPLSFLQAGCPSCHPTNSVKALKALMLYPHGDRIVTIDSVTSLHPVLTGSQFWWRPQIGGRNVIIRKVTFSCVSATEQQHCIQLDWCEWRYYSTADDRVATSCWVGSATSDGGGDDETEWLVSSTTHVVMLA